MECEDICIKKNPNALTSIIILSLAQLLGRKKYMYIYDYRKERKSSVGTPFSSGGLVKLNSATTAVEVPAHPTRG